MSCPDFLPLYGRSCCNRGLALVYGECKYDDLTRPDMSSHDFLSYDALLG